MAERRMMAKSVIDTDAFLDMPASTQSLYFHMLLRADDDGFIASPKGILRIISASEDDLKLLLAKQYLFRFESGVVVIKDWKIHNYIQSDRYKPSLQPERKLLNITANKEYTLTNSDVSDMDTKCIQNVSIGKVRLDKVRLDKASIGKNNILSSKHDYASNEMTEIIDYLNLKTNKRYKTTTQKTRSLIKARMNEHFTVDDFKIVINKMCTEWIGTKMEKYLRPETLFGTKFESYLNQTLSKSETEMRIDNVNALIDQYEREEVMSNGQGGYSESNSTIDCDVQKRY